MHSLFVMLFSLSLLHFTQAQTASIKLNQTFSSRNINTISLDIPNYNVKIKSIKGSIVVVETSVEINSNNFRLLDFIAKNGRYNLTGSIDEDSKNLQIKEPLIKDKIKIKGKNIIEQIVYTIYIPETKKLNDIEIVAGH